MQITETKIKPQFIRCDKDKKYSDTFKGQPIRTRKDDYIFKCDTLTTITFDADDINEIKELYGKTFKPVHKAEEVKAVILPWLIKYIVEKNNFDEENLTVGAYDQRYYIDIEDSMVINLLQEKHMTTVTTISSAEKRKMKVLNDKEADGKIFDTFFRPNVEIILKKYGLKETYRGGHVIFKDCTALKEFIQTAIKNTIVKELEELGLEVPLYNRWNRFDSYATLFKINAIKIKKDMIE